MAWPIPFPLEPMLAKAVGDVPEKPGLLYEPKWDGFRSIAYIGDGEVELASRGAKTLTRYFPELVAELSSQLRNVVLDGEIVVRRGSAGGERLDWEALSQRIHPAASRIQKLSAETPASFVAFDLLAVDGESLLDRPFADRRALLEQRLGGIHAPLHLTRTTSAADDARRWLEEFEGAGLDGVVAKPVDARYEPGKRTMLKIKHVRTADAVVHGYRVHKSGSGVGSLLLGLYRDGHLQGVGGASAFTDRRRQELIEELDPYVVRDENGEPVRGAGERNRFSSEKDGSFIRLEPKLVVEVKYDQMEGDRFRHAVQFLRWRPDRDPESCTYEQLEVPAKYDLSDVLSS
ncbi:ATP-dependent DNA ligase [Desertivibrio insolitus]|uniref:ATP-dependent DNA ligase n=1 Tax=Herbiconiux sp. SYSU D00978 TaxID=2812562 RepID=UPI001A95D2C1|nr:ATP-dependent DNA ligase [Herbiconiux sp. SYSU D00978]